MRRLAVFLTLAMLVQGLIFGSLAPLLPSFEDDLGLSKVQAGLLVGMFPIGQAMVALPLVLFASRVGVKRFSLCSLVVFAVSSAAFGFADGYDQLLAARFLQGVGGGLCLPAGLAWLVTVAPRSRRVEMIGFITGGAAAGQMVGPAVGGLAVFAGRGAMFAGVAVLFVILVIVGSRLPAPEHAESQSKTLAAIRRAHRSPAVVGGHLLVAVPSMGLGAVFALAPLQMHRLGWGPLGIAATFVVTAGVGALARPLVGRWADRRNLLRAISILLLVPVPPVLLMSWLGSRWLVSACVVTMVAVWGALFGPTAAFLSRTYEALGMVQMLGFGLTSLVAAMGIFLGSAAGGSIAKLAGDATAYGLVAAASLSAVVAVGIRRRTRAPQPVLARAGDN